MDGPLSGNPTAPSEATADGATSRAGSFVLLVLASGQFLMTLDTSVMNVSIKSVANDLGTTVSGIQTAITLYTLVMAAFMITGGKVGALIGRRRAFGIGLAVYGVGTLITAAAPNLTVLIIGWSVFEGLGAALIMPAIVALVAGNFPAERRSAAYGLIAAAGAIAVAAGPLIGGAVTTFASWRWVFVGEAVIVVGILFSLRKVADLAPEKRVSFDFLGAALSVAGLSLTVLGVLNSGVWGWVKPKPNGPAWLGVSPVVWLVLAGLLLIGALLLWESRLERLDREPLFRPSMFRSVRLSGGLIAFFFQFLIQAGIFFTIPLFLSVVLALSALQTGVRLLPLSITLLIAAVAIPKVFPRASPRLVVRIGMLCMLAGVLVLVGGLDPAANAGIVLIPMALVGLGIGALASQLGAITVSAVPDSQSAEVGGLQNTFTNFGASLGTALVGAVLIGSLTTSFIQGVTNNPAVPPDVTAKATVEMSSGIPFISDGDLRAALGKTDLSGATQDAIVAENASARLDGLRSALWLVALLTVVGLFFTGMLPRRATGALRDTEGNPAWAGSP
ncbi:MAG TPA: MFS transporter [Acidimicrobiales bacterium]|nr:MFS transporter [Acidimicrobiales bacterium]